MKNPGATK